ncbi:MAG: hypothetical protein ABIP75_07625 [Pyrinomonadaceae bacterium]
MKNKNCQPFQLEIEDAASGNRSIGAPVRAHLAGCTDCAGTFGEHSRLRELIAGLEPVTAPADFDFRLRARLANARSAKPAFGWSWQTLRTPALGLASAVVLVVGGLTVFNSGVMQLGSNGGSIAATGITVTEGSALEWSGPAAIAEVNGASKETSPAAAPNRTIQNSSTGGGVSEPRGGGVLESAVKGPAPTILPEGFNNSDPTGNAEFAVPVRPSDASARILLDERGRTRNVKLRNVSFGSQDLMEPAVMRTLPPASQRIW